MLLRTASSDYIPRMFYASDTPRTDLATYLRCLLEAVRRMLGGRWGFLARPAAALLMGAEARQAMLQVAAAFEQLAVLLEQFRAGTLVPETPAEDALQEEAEATPREVAPRPRPSMARREPRRRSPGSTPELRCPSPSPRAKAASQRRGSSWRRTSPVCPLSQPSLAVTGGFAGDFFKNRVLGCRGYCVHFVTISKRNPSARRQPRASANLSLRQPAFGDAAGDREGGVEDVADIVADDLPHQMAGGARVQPVILAEPAQHLGGRVLQRLVERAGVADGEDVVGRLAARPGRSSASGHGTSPPSRTRSRCRCRRSRRRPGRRGRRRDRTARPAPRPETTPSSPARTGDSPCCRRSARWSRSSSACPRAGATPKQPIIGCERRGEVLQALRRLAQPHGPGIAVDDPRPRVPCAGRSGIAAGSSTVKASGEIGPAGRPARRQPVDADGQRVAGLGAFDEERPGHRVRPLGDRDLARVETGGVDRVGYHRIAVGDPQARLGGADDVEVARRTKSVISGKSA